MRVTPTSPPTSPPISLRLTIALLLLSPLAFAGFSNSTLNPGQPSRFELRNLYQEAIDDIRSGRWSSYRDKKPRLEAYPLYPWLEYTEKIYTIQNQSPDDIRTFIDAYGESPVADRLLENWIFTLGVQKRWETLLDFYDPSRVRGKRNACFHARALQRTGREEEAMQAAGELWRVGYSQPDECDAVFRQFRDAGGVDRENAWRRFVLAMEDREYSLASYLTRYLDGEDKTLAERFRQLPKNPSLIRRTDLFRADDAHTREAIVYGIKRLARRDAEAAFEALESYRASHTFESPVLTELYTWVGRRLALDEDPNGLLELVPLDLHELPALTESRIRMALRQQDWGQVLVLINLLPEAEQNSPRWKYWKARVLIASDEKVDRDQGRALFEELAGIRRFYGFMAADALGIPYDFRDEPAAIPESELLQIEAMPGIQRALELLAIDDRVDARIEWAYATRNFDDRGLQVAARVAMKWGWYRQAITSMIDAEAWDDLEIRFPLAYRHEFVRHSRRWDIPLHWSFAIARQESAFMPDARSSAGARGIMQLMPGTARVAANVHGLGYADTDELLDPGTNIELGTAYLGQMLRRFNNNRILASAAYNAGPARVDRWLDPSLPLDVWIETIPFEETREYVQSVLMFASIYARALEQTQPFIYAHEWTDFSNQRVTLFAEDEMQPHALLGLE